MLGKKQLLVLLVAVCLLAFGGYFFKPYAIGYDSYYFLQPNGLESEPIGSFYAFSLLRGNILLAKALLFLCLYASSVSIALLGSLFNEKHGWKAGFLIFLSPIVILEVLKIESEAIAYPILFLSLYFLFKAGWKNKLVACTLISFASLFWLGSLTFFVVASFYFLPMLIAAIPFTLVAFWRFNIVKYIGDFLPNPRVNEAAYLGAGLTFHWGLWIFAGIAAWKKDERMLKLLPGMAFLGLLAFLNSRFGILLAPFLAVMVANSYEWLERKRLLSGLYGILAVMVLFSPLVIHTIYEPRQDQIESVQLAVEQAEGEMIYNDWQYGHMIEYFGGKAYAKAGGMWPDVNCSACVKLTERELQAPCKCINCPASLAVYECPPSIIGKKNLTKQ